MEETLPAYLVAYFSRGYPSVRDRATGPDSKWVVAVVNARGNTHARQIGKDGFSFDSD
jgi:hypothetical protein